MLNMIPVHHNGFQRETPYFDFADDFFRPLFNDWTPFKVDVRDMKDSYRLEAELPGVAREALSVKIRDGVLTVSVRNEGNSEKKKNDYLYRERFIGNMTRSFRLDGIDEEKVNAKFADGLLTVELPKANENESEREIEIA